MTEDIKTKVNKELDASAPDVEEDIEYTQVFDSPIGAGPVDTSIERSEYQEPDEAPEFSYASHGETRDASTETTRTEAAEESLEEAIARDAAESGSPLDGSVEKTAVWEVIAPAEDGEEVDSEDAEAEGIDAADSNSGDVDDTKTAKSESTIDVSKPDAKRTFEMPYKPDWNEKPTGLSDNNDESMPKPGPNPEDAEIIEKIRERKIQNAAKQKRDKFRMKFGIIAGVIIIAAFALSLTNIFVVDSLEVKGNSHFTGEEIINIGHASAGRNIFYRAGKKEIVENLEDNPYIKSANVKRKLPATLVIEVEEREEACALKYDDDYLVVDSDGILLRKTNTVPKLTEVEGMVVSKIKLGETLGTKDKDLFKSALNLIKSMRKADMYFVRIDMSNSNEVSAYIYETLKVKTDYNTLKENLDNGRLHIVVEKLFNDGIQRGTITFKGDDMASFEPGL